MANSTAHTDDFNHVIGQGFSDGVKKTLNNKQKSLARKNRATIMYNNNNSPWIKLASSVRVVGQEGADKLVNSGLSANLIGNSLALNFFLFSEMKGAKTSTQETGEGEYETVFNPYTKNYGIAGRSSRGKYNSAYGFGGLEFGLVPLPGIHDLQVETLGNNGSLKKATVKIKAFNKVQFNIIELLYLRLGYHVLLEYGRRLYLTSSSSVKTVGNTLLENSWFGDENFVDVNDPELEEINNEILDNQEEITVLEDQNEELERQQQEAEAEIRREEGLTGNGEPKLNRDEERLLYEAKLDYNLTHGPGAAKDEDEQDVLRWWADNSRGAQQKKNPEMRALADRYDAYDDAVETAKTAEEQQEKNQEEIDKKTEEIQELREDVEEKLDDYLDNLNKEINSLRNKYNFDYDGFIGRVTNFDWTLDVNGVYNITVEIFSAGDVLQSLSVNNRNSPAGTYETTAQKDGSNPLNITKEAGDIITALNNLGTLARGYKVTDEEEFARSQTSKQDQAVFTGETDDYDYDEVTVRDDTTQETLDRAEFLAAEKASKDLSYMRGYAVVGSDAAKVSPLVYLNRIDTVVRLIGDTTGAYLDGFDFLGKQTTKNMYTGYNGSGFEVVKVKAEGSGVAGNAYYIRLGYYLKFLQAITIPKFAGQGRLGKPMLRILTEQKKYPFFKNDLLASSRPSVCVVRTSVNVKHYLDNAGGNLTIPADINDDPVLEVLEANEGKEFFANINYKIDGIKYGDIMNIYLNMDYLAKSIIDEDTDEKGDVNFLQHVSKICKDVNDSFGNITQIDFKIDEDRNIVYFIDRKLQPNIDGILDNANKPKNPYVFNITGFANISGVGTLGSIVRKFNLKSSIPPNLATMITVGSNQHSQGHTGRTDATAFSKWNTGLQDKVLPVKFIEGYDPQYRNGKPTITTIKKRNVTYQKYFTQLATLYTPTIVVDDSSTTKTNYRFLWITVWSTTDRELDTDEQSVNGVNLTVESGMMEYQRKAVSIPQDTAATETNKASPTAGFLPIDLDLTFDGTSGIKIFETYTVPSRFLPRSYPNAMTFIVKKLTNTINASGWSTRIQSFSVPNTQGSDASKTYYSRGVDLSPTYTISGPSGTGTGTNYPVTVPRGTSVTPPSSAIYTPGRSVITVSEYSFDPTSRAPINTMVNSTALDDLYDPPGSIYFMQGGEGIGYFHIGSAYGPRWGRLHAGLDIAMPNGSFVAVQTSGTIVEAKFGPAAGGAINFVPDGTTNFTARIIHLNRIYVRPGDRVVAGQVICTSGGGVGDDADTKTQKGEGKSSGAHIHYEATVNGWQSAFDPDSDWSQYNPSLFFRVGGPVTSVPDPR